MSNRAYMAVLVLLAGCKIDPVTFTQEHLGTVTVSKTGAGTITSLPAGIDCGGTCSGAFRDGTQITLTATPDASSAFTGWSGACAGTGPCVLDVAGDTSVDVGATFATATLEIALAGDSAGEVVSDPPGISCGAMCTAMFPPGSRVTLTARPLGSPSAFAGWSVSACSDVGPCALTLTDETTALTARFTSHGSKAFTATGAFTVPPGVTSVHVLAIGGGGGGANGHQGGGGSGLVAAGTFAVTPGAMVQVTVVGPGRGADPCNACNEIVGNTAGGTSAFGMLLSAAGGKTPTMINGPGADGGSGGGGSCNAGLVGGAGGTGGANGGACTYIGGIGQGDFAIALAAFSVHTFTAGTGGAGGMSSRAGGGGGGGVLMDGAGPGGGNGAATFSGKGGAGFGGGGGGGGYDGASGEVREAGGNGAPGLVYIEW